VKADRGEFDNDPSFEAMQNRTKHIPAEKEKAKGNKQ
jgi:hypothetical protein